MANLAPKNPPQVEDSSLELKIYFMEDHRERVSGLSRGKYNALIVK